jgi:hypothetical protein
MSEPGMEVEREREGLSMVLAGLTQGLDLMPGESASARALRPLGGRGGAARSARPASATLSSSLSAASWHAA